MKEKDGEGRGVHFPSCHLVGGKENRKEGESENSKLTLHSHSNILKWGTKVEFHIDLKNSIPLLSGHESAYFGQIDIGGHGRFCFASLLPRFFCPTKKMDFTSPSKIVLGRWTL